MASHRLLVVTESMGIGGTESHLLRTLPPLVVLGYDITVFCLTERGEGASSLEKGGINVVAPVLKAPRTRPIRYAGHLLYEARRLYALMRHSRPDIVHFYLPRPYLIGAPAAIAAGVPIKIMSRRSLANYQMNWPTAARIERRLHHRMDALIGNSAAVVNDLLAEDAASRESETHLQRRHNSRANSA